MYYQYHDLKTDKRRGVVIISYIVEKILETISDDFNGEIETMPEFIEKEIYDKLELAEKYDRYEIYTRFCEQPGRISDYKKIWGLCGFDEKGIFDSAYPKGSGKIYFDITVRPATLSNPFLCGNLTIFSPKAHPLDCKNIYSVFADKKYDLADHECDILDFLRTLGEKFPDIIALSDQSISHSRVVIVGKNVESKFSDAITH